MQPLSDQEFGHFQRFIRDAAGIHLASTKKALVAGRLARRVHARGQPGYGAYFELLRAGDAGEVQAAVDLLTTNETYFFREGKHFELLRELSQRASAPLKVWSAASSSGEEVYSIAMVQAEVHGLSPSWRVIGTDISTRVLARARRGHYPMSRAQQLPPALLHRWCLRGRGEHEGTLLIAPELRRQVQFDQLNLNEPLPGSWPMFDLIFLRNVMIYFDLETKRRVVARLLQQLQPGGHLLIGHSESLNDVSDACTAVAPSIYRKPAAGAR